MSKTWKWIIGIVIGLVVIAVLGFVGWNTFEAAHFNGMAYRAHAPLMQNFDRGVTPRGNFERGMPMNGGRFPNRFGGYMPFFSGFFLLGWLFRLIIPLGILFLVGFFSYKKGKKDGVATVSAAPVEAPVKTEEPSPEQE